MKFGPKNVLLVGFTTFKGTILASTFSGGKPIQQVLNLAAEGSFEFLFHEKLKELKCESLIVSKHQTQQYLMTRAIGLVYNKSDEISAHYYRTSISDQYDIVVHIDKTNSLLI